ncbi:MAG: PilZ domain-containing protein [Nitrospirales bacterium]
MGFSVSLRLLTGKQQFHRLFPRVRVTKPCRVAWADAEVRGSTKDLSYGGVAAELPRDLKWRDEKARLVLLPEGMTLRVRPIRYERRGITTKVAFQVEGVERGERQWQQLTQLPRW